MAKEKELITSNVLEDISRHSNKIVRLSKFLAETQFAFYAQKMLYISNNDSPFDLINAFNADLNETVKLIQKISAILETTDSDGINKELKNDVQDLKVLFPANYNVENNVLTIFNIEVKAKSKFALVNNKELKSALLRNLLPNISLKEFSNHVSLLKNFDSNGLNSQESSFSESITYASKLVEIDNWKPVYKQILTLADKVGEIRQKLTTKQRSFVDSKITGLRAMVDSVAQTSTYISKNKEDDIKQTSNKHKDYQKVLVEIEELVKKIPFISGCEIDQDASPEKVRDILLSLTDFNPDSATTFEYKVRKLGNYAATGLMVAKNIDTEKFAVAEEYGFASNKLKIVAQDVNSSSSFIHEWSHFRDDRENYSSFRDFVVNHFSKQINRQELLNMVGKNYSNYIFNDREIIARLGEIGYTLNVFGYQDNESIDSFSQRISGIVQENTFAKKYNMALNKPWDIYLGKNNPVYREIYFNVGDMSPEDLAIIRDYTHDFFFKQEPAISIRLEHEIEQLKKYVNSYELTQKKKSQKKYRRRVKSEEEMTKEAFGLLTLESIVPVYHKGRELDLFSDGEFSLEMLRTPSALFRGKNPKKSIYQSEVENQINGWSALVQSLNINEHPADCLIMERFIYNFLNNNSVLSDENIKTLCAFDNVMYKQSGAKLVSSLSKYMLRRREVYSELLEDSLIYMKDHFRDKDFNSVIPLKDFSVNDELAYYAICEYLFEQRFDTSQDIPMNLVAFFENAIENQLTQCLDNEQISQKFPEELNKLNESSFSKKMPPIFVYRFNVLLNSFYNQPKLIQLIRSLQTNKNLSFVSKNDFKNVLDELKNNIEEINDISDNYQINDELIEKALMTDFDSPDAFAGLNGLIVGDIDNVNIELDILPALIKGLCLCNSEQVVKNAIQEALKDVFPQAIDWCDLEGTVRYKKSNIEMIKRRGNARPNFVSSYYDNLFTKYNEKDELPSELLVDFNINNFSKYLMLRSKEQPVNTKKYARKVPIKGLTSNIDIGCFLAEETHSFVKNFMEIQVKSMDESLALVKKAYQKDLTPIYDNSEKMIRNLLSINKPMTIKVLSHLQGFLPMLHSARNDEQLFNNQVSLILASLIIDNKAFMTSNQLSDYVTEKGLDKPVMTIDVESEVKPVTPEQSFYEKLKAALGEEQDPTKKIDINANVPSVSDDKIIRKKNQLKLF